MTRRSSALKTAALVIALLFGFALRGRAQSTEGYVDIMMLGEFNDGMLAFAITTADYDTLYYYVPHVHMMFMKEHDYQPINVWLGDSYGTGGEIFDYALASVTAPVEAGVPYSAYADHSIDIYFYDEWNYGWYDYYGYGLLELPYPWDLPRFEVWVWAAPIITAIQYLQSLNMGQTAKEAFFAPPPTLSCPGSVTRDTNVTCNVSGVAEGQVLGWSFTGDDQSGNVSGPSSVTHWSGTMVQSGTVSVTLSAGLTAPTPVHITVNNRSWSSQLPSSTQVHEGEYMGQRCPASVFASYPMDGAELGYYCTDLLSSAVTVSQPISGGPNDGLLYVTNVSFTELYYKWKIHPLLEDTNSNFYKAQCGQGGFTLNTTLVANALRHEGGPSPSHYNSFSDAWNDPSLNPPAVAEVEVGRGRTRPEFANDVAVLINQKWDVIRQRAAAEPCGDGRINLNSSCVYNGPVNMYEFRNGQYELDPCP